MLTQKGDELLVPESWSYTNPFASDQHTSLTPEFESLYVVDGGITNAW